MSDNLLTLLVVTLLVGVALTLVLTGHGGWVVLLAIAVVAWREQ